MTKNKRRLAKKRRKRWRGQAEWNRSPDMMRRIGYRFVYAMLDEAVSAVRDDIWRRLLFGEPGGPRFYGTGIAEMLNDET